MMVMIRAAVPDAIQSTHLQRLALAFDSWRQRTAQGRQLSSQGSRLLLCLQRLLLQAQLELCRLHRAWARAC